MKELLEKYFENTLSTEEQLLFDERLQNDKKFKEAFEFHAELKNAVTISERQKIKSEIRSFEAQEKSTVKVFKFRKLLPYAAILVIAISTGLYFYAHQNTTDGLYAYHFEPYPNIETSILRSDGERSLENDAFTAYDLEDYKKASGLFSKLLEKDPKVYFRFYKAICLMQLENFDLALQQLDEIMPENSEYYEKAIWFRALTYLKLNETDKSKQLLNQLVSKYTFKNVEAKKLLSEL
ncbi:tetratricopeptide repeat protein [Xanthomarina gelatinilytica]|uniref:tetratricopeptide repeat protein n=1 Tax=Xanthomarina gelatinilytica TaxID=1137281 RepID=UPI003AA8038A